MPPTINNKKILDLNTRKKIYETVKKFAGSNFREIVKKSNLSNGVVAYHLHYLIRHDLIREERRSNNSVMYFPRYFNPHNSIMLGVLRQKSLREIILFVLTNKNCTHDSIVRFTKLSPSTISWHLKKLESKGITSSIKTGRNKHYKIRANEDEIMGLLITYKESFLDSLVNKVIQTWDMG